MSITWVEKDELTLAALRVLDDVDVVLDIGCGIRPQDYVLPKVHICCDPCEQYIERLRDKVKDKNDREYVFVQAGWSEIVDKFLPKSVDTVFLLDVIEHLDKDSASELLKATEKIARRQIVIFTPLGFVVQHSADGKDNWGLDGGKWQEHKSGWQPGDFDDSWNIFAAKIFHTHDHTGEEYINPFGAFWAIKNLQSTTYTLAPVPRPFISKEAAYKAARAELLYCRLTVPKPEKEDLYQLYLVFSRKGGNKKKWESTKITPYNKAFKEFLVVEPQTNQDMLITPKDVFETLKRGYDFDSAYSVYRRNRAKNDLKPSIAFTILNSSVAGGGGANVFRYANWLSDLGVDVAVYSDDRPPDWTSVKGRFYSIPRSDQRYAAIAEPVVIIYSVKELQDLLFLGDCTDKVIYHLCQGVEEYHYGLDYQSLTASKPMFEFLFSLPVGRIAVSPHIRDYFQKNYSQRTYDIFNGIDIEFFSPRPEKTPGKTIKILSSGNPFHAFKGKIDIRNALNILSKTHPQWQFELTIACGQRIDENCFSWIGNNYQVKLVTALSPKQMRQEYYDTDVYVNSSWYEGFGLPSLEAMACGVPLIQADNQGLWQIARDNENCLLYPPNEPTILAEKIATILQDDALRRELIKNGIETARNFTLANQYEMFVRQFERILHCRFDRPGSERETYQQLLPAGVSPVLGSRCQEAPAIVSRKSSEPMFSIMVPAYNQAQYLPAALDSLVAQTVGDWEAIVIDDGSTDQTGEVAQKASEKDPRIRVFHKDNGGVASALNEALRRGRGEWFCWLSSDDMFQTNKLAVHLQQIKKNPDIGFFYTHYFVLIEEAGTIVPAQLDLDKFLPPPKLEVLKFFEHNYINGISVAIHRDIFEDVGFFNEGYKNGQDFDMWLRISERYLPYFIEERTCVTRLHAGQGTNSFPQAGTFDSARACLEFLNKHRFPALFPALDLTRVGQILLVIQNCFRILKNSSSFINRCGFGPALMDRFREWLTQSVPGELRRMLKPELAEAVDEVQQAEVSREIKDAFVTMYDLLDRPFHYKRYDPVQMILKHAGMLQQRGDVDEAFALKRYIERISSKVYEPLQLVKS